MKLEAEIEVLAGRFASQQLAFAHLLDAAASAGLSPDLDHVEIVQPPHDVRLRGYFDPETAERIEALADGMALVLVLPGTLVTGRFETDDRLTRLGRFRGRMIRA